MPLLNNFPSETKITILISKMISYFGMHSAKQSMRNKGTKFGYKNFVLTIFYGYSYHVSTCSGAQGVAGTPRRELNSRVIVDLLTEIIVIKPNLAFDN